MGLGEEVKVRLDGLRQVMTEAGRGEAAEAFIGALQKEELQGNEISVYQGKVGDGSIIIEGLSMGDTRPTRLRMEHYGSITNTDTNEYAKYVRIDAVAARLVLSALFTTQEVGIGNFRDEEEKIIAQGMEQAAGCFVVGRRDCPSNIAVSIRDKILEFRQKKAEAERATARQQTSAMAAYIDDMISWARGNDHWYNSIEPEDIENVRQKYQSRLLAVTDDIIRRDLYKGLLIEAVQTSSGRQYALEKKYMTVHHTTLERGGYCSKSEWDFGDQWTCTKRNTSGQEFEGICGRPSGSKNKSGTRVRTRTNTIVNFPGIGEIINTDFDSEGCDTD